MPDTPGQVAYDVWRLALQQTVGVWSPSVFATWNVLRPVEQAAWEAAAWAVLTPRVAGQAAQLHALIDDVVAHAPQAYLDKVHIWLTDLSGIVHQEYQEPQQKEDAHETRTL
jgi:hypothetical protein